MTIAFPDVLKSYLDLPKQEINLYQYINNIHSAKVCLVFFPKNGRKIKRDFQNLLKIFTGSTLTYFGDEKF